MTVPPQLRSHLSPELTEYVVSQLSRSTPLRNIILEVCDRSNMEWKEAEVFVQQVSEAQRKEIGRRQFPFMAGLSVLITLGGIGIVLFECWGLYLSWPAIPLNTPETTSLIGVWLVGNARLFYGVIIGLAMIAGGGLGLGRSIAATREA